DAALRPVDDDAAFRSEEELVAPALQAFADQGFVFPAAVDARRIEMVVPEIECAAEQPGAFFGRRRSTVGPGEIHAAEPYGMKLGSGDRSCLLAHGRPMCRASRQVATPIRDRPAYSGPRRRSRPASAPVHRSSGDIPPGPRRCWCCATWPGAEREPGASRRTSPRIRARS